MINTGLKPEFQVVERFVPSILTQSVGVAVKVDTRLMLDRAYIVAKRSGVAFNVATIPAKLQYAKPRRVRSRLHEGAVQVGFEQGKSANPFANAPPPYPGQPPKLIIDRSSRPQPEQTNEERLESAVAAIAVAGCWWQCAATPSPASDHRRNASRIARL